MTWIAPKRSVDPGARRRQTREVLIYNREDLNRALTEAYKNPTRISVLKLAADIVLTANMQINQCNVTIDGGNLYGFTASTLLYTVTSYADLTLANLRNNNVKFNILNVPFKIDNCQFQTDTFQYETAVDMTIDPAQTVKSITITDSTFHNFNVPFACTSILGQYIQLSAKNINLSAATPQALVISTDCNATIYDLKYLNLLDDLSPANQLTLNISNRSIINNCSLTNLVITGTADCVISNNCFFNGGWDSSAAFRSSYVNNSKVATKVFGPNDLDLDSSLPNSSSQINIAAAGAPVIGNVLTATSATTATWQAPTGGPATDIVVVVKNSDPALLSATVNKGTVVYISGSTGANAYFNISTMTTDAGSAYTLGLLETTLIHNAIGNVVTLGIMTNMNTAGMADGAALYLGTTGAYTTTKPTQPNHEVRLGYVIKGGSVGGGIIFVRVQNGYELEELHDVLAPGSIKGDILVRNGSNLWVNVAVGTNTHVLTADSTTATGVKWAAGGGGGGGTFGTFNVTFSRSVHSVTTTVADAGVSALSNILVSIGIPSTRDIDEMELAPVVAAVGTIVPGVSFNVIAVSIDGDADGIYNIKYTRD